MRLLSRTTRHLSVTEEGHDFFKRCRHILAEIDDAEQAVSASRAQPKGNLRVTATVGFATHQIVPLIPEFQARYPDIRMDLWLTNRVVDLVEEGMDVAIRFGELQESSLVARKLALDHRVICASPAYLKRHGVPRTPDDLQQHNCMTISTDTGMNQWVFKEQGQTVARHMEGTFRVNHGDVLYDAVLAGIGIACLPTYIVGEDIKRGRLRAILTDSMQETASIYAVYPHRRHLTPKVRAFVDFLLEKFTPTPPWALNLGS